MSDDLVDRLQRWADDIYEAIPAEHRHERDRYSSIATLDAAVAEVAEVERLRGLLRNAVDAAAEYAHTVCGEFDVHPDPQDKHDWPVVTEGCPMDDVRWLAGRTYLEDETTSAWPIIRCEREALRARITELEAEVARRDRIIKGLTCTADHQRGEPCNGIVPVEGDC